MQSKPDPTYHPFVISSISLFIIGWGSVAYTILMLTPTVWARWLLFFGATLGLISLGLPIMWFLNLRFRSDPPAGAGVIVRQATWAGVYGAVLIWLQQVRLVTIWSCLGLAAGLVAIEYLVRMREKARWRPKPLPEAATPAPEEPGPTAETPPAPQA